MLFALLLIAELYIIAASAFMLWRVDAFLRQLAAAHTGGHFASELAQTLNNLRNYAGGDIGGIGGMMGIALKYAENVFARIVNADSSNGERKDTQKTPTSHVEVRPNRHRKLTNASIISESHQTHDCKQASPITQAESHQTHDRAHADAHSSTRQDVRVG